MLGKKRIEFARENMPVAELIGMKWELSKFVKEQDVF